MRHRNFKVIVIIALFLGIAGSLPVSAARKEVSKLSNVKVEEILDGDTIVVREQAYSVGRARDRYIIDLAGVSAPPPDEDAGQEAIKFLKYKVLRKSADAEYVPQMNGWKVSVGGIRDVSAEMIERGLVKRNNDNGEYVSEEERAKEKKKGVWQQPDKPADSLSDADLSMTEDTLHTSPDTFHDLSQGIQQQNYVQQRPAYQQGYSYDLTMTGSDSFYERATAPRTLYVFPSSRRKLKGLFFIITGMNYRLIEELRPNEFVTVKCIFIKMVNVRDWYGDKQVPLFKYIGKAPTLGVGGEIMYYD